MDYFVKKEKVICKKLNIFIHSSSIFETMPRRPDKFLPENELSSLIRDELIRSLLPDPLNDAVYHNHLSDLPTLAELFSGLQYLNRLRRALANCWCYHRVSQLPREQLPREVPYDAGELLGSCRAAQNSGGAGGGHWEGSLPANSGSSRFLDQQAVHLKGFE